MTDTQSYETVRRTTVRRLAPKPALTKPEAPQPVEAPKPKVKLIAKFEIIGDDERKNELVLCDGIMPRQLAEMLKRMVDAWYIS